MKQVEFYVLEEKRQHRSVTPIKTHVLHSVGQGGLCSTHTLGVLV